MGLSYVWQTFFYAAHNIFGHCTKENFAQLLSTLHVIFYFYISVFYVTSIRSWFSSYDAWTKACESFPMQDNLKRLWCCSHTIHLLNALHTRNKDVLMNTQGFINSTLRVQKDFLFISCDIITGTKPWRNRIKIVCVLWKQQIAEYNKIVPQENFCLHIIRKLFKLHLNSLWYHYISLWFVIFLHQNISNSM